MARDKPPICRPATRFAGKVWIYVAQAAIFGHLGGVSAVLGPLFLFGLLESADGRPTTDAGIALCIMSIPFLLMFALAIFNFCARREPVIQMFEQGIEARLVGVSSLAHVPFLPEMVYVAWAIVSRQGFRTQIVRCRWPAFQRARIGGMPLERTLKISGDFRLARDGEGVGYESIVFGEAEFASRLEPVVQALYFYAERGEERALLSKWAP